MLLAIKPTAIQRLATLIVQIFPRLLGALFIFTAIQKWRNFGSFRQIVQFDHFPEPLVSPTVWIIIVVELILGAMLVSFIWLRRPALLVSIGLLVLYTLQIGYLLIWNDAPDCGCMEGTAEFGQGRTRNMLGLARNLCLILPAIWTWMQIAPCSPRALPEKET